MTKKSDILLIVAVLALIIIGGIVSFASKHQFIFLIITCFAGILVLAGHKVKENQSQEQAVFPNIEENNSEHAHCLERQVFLKKPDILDKDNSNTIKVDTSSISDECANWINNLSDPIPIECKLHIDYLEKDGELTSTDVELDCFHESGTFYAFCKQAQESRFFDNDRVKSCIDIDTGQVIEDISKFFSHRNATRRLRQTGGLHLDEKDFFRSLKFVAKADNYLRKNERQIFHKAIREFAATDKFEEKSLNAFIDRTDLISLHAFKLAVGRLHKKDPNAFDIVHKYSKEMLKIEKEMHPTEADALDFLERKSKQKY